MKKYESNIKKRFSFFIHIFILIIKEKIKFPSAGARPIICNQCFVSNNKFRINCQHFIRYFGNGIEWKGCPKKTKIIYDESGEKKSQYISNKTRAQNATETFVNCLKDINNSFNKQSNESINQQIENWFNYIIIKKYQIHSIPNHHYVHSQKGNLLLLFH